MHSMYVAYILNLLRFLVSAKANQRNKRFPFDSKEKRCQMLDEFFMCCTFQCLTSSGSVCCFCNMMSLYVVFKQFFFTA